MSNLWPGIDWVNHVNQLFNNSQANIKHLLYVFKLKENNNNYFSLIEKLI